MAEDLHVQNTFSLLSGSIIVDSRFQNTDEFLKELQEDIRKQFCKAELKKGFIFVVYDHALASHADVLRGSSRVPNP